MMKKRTGRLIATAIAAAGFFVQAAAQVGDPRNDIAIGVNGGMTMNSISFDPTIKQRMLMAPTFGVTFRYVCERYYTAYCALQVELNYVRLGWKENIENSQNEPLPDRYERHLDYVQIPMFARMAWGKEHKGAMFFFQAGPQIGYCISESSEQSDVWTLNEDGTPDRPNSFSSQYDMSIDRKFDYGIVGGLGLEVHTPIGHFLLEGRYYYGLADVFNNSKTDVFARSNNNTITVKLTYLFDIVKTGGRSR